MIPGSANPLLLATAAGAGGYEIERSLRFNSSDSAYLSRTPASAGNRKTWTWAGWVKRATFGTGYIFGCFTSGNDYCLVYPLSGGNIRFEAYNSGTRVLRLDTANLFRDPSAWYHFVFTLDTSSATESSRAKIYVNGAEVTLASGQYPTQNTDLQVNTTNAHEISSSVTPFSGYLADIHFIDGQALDPSSFGEFDTNGVWQPIAYTGSYGTNGFHLKFADNSSNTATTLGKDSSGNGNNWTPNNLSVTAGAGNDSLVDTPTSYGTDTGAGGEVRGNYCTWNPLINLANNTLANGNLDATHAASSWNSSNVQGNTYATFVGTLGVLSGKWYWEITPTSATTGSIGVTNTPMGGQYYVGYPGNGIGYTSTIIYQDPAFGSTASSLASYAQNDVIGVALDLDNGKIFFSVNGTYINSADPVAGTGSLSSNVFGTFYPAVSQLGSADGIIKIANFGQRPFASAAPSGFKALCDTNLPSTTITTSGSYTGNGVADGPFVYLNGVPTAMTVGGNAVTFGTHADKLSNGFKIRTTSTTYNQNASVYNYTITSTGAAFKNARAQSNP